MKYDSNKSYNIKYHIYTAYKKTINKIVQVYEIIERNTKTVY